MLEIVLAFAYARWEVWFGRPPATRLIPVILTERGKLARRAAVVIFEGDVPHPSALMKLALTQLDAEALSREQDALTQLRNALPFEWAKFLPRPLGFSLIDSECAISVQATIRGKRLITPPLLRRSSPVRRHLLRQYITAIRNWSFALSKQQTDGSPRDLNGLASIIEEFDSTFDCSESARSRLDRFRERLLSSKYKYYPCWQHGDVSPGNLLTYRHTKLLVDWERARGSYEPSADLCQIPSILLLSAHSELPGASMDTLAHRILSKSSWVGSLVGVELQSGWHHDFPPTWGVLLSTMRQALEARHFSQDGGRFEASVAECLLVNERLYYDIPWLNEPDLS